MQRTNTQKAGTPALVACAAALLLAAGCHGYGKYHKHSGSSVILEQEPNDSSSNPQPIAFLSASDYVVIKGHIDDSGFDPYDGFAFTVDRPVEVDVTLSTYGSGADLDLVVYDPLIDADVVFFQSPYDPEGGVFYVDATPFDPVDFDLVVNSFAGSSSYTLEVRTYPLPATYAASSPAPGAPEASDASRLGVGAGGTATSAAERAGRFDAWSAQDGAPEAGTDEADEPVAPLGGVLILLGENGAVLETRPAALAGDTLVVGD